MTEIEMFRVLIYGLIGIFGALSIAVFIWGFITYLVKLGLPSEQRKPGLHIMEWSIGLIITVFALVGVLRFVEYWFHP